MDIFGEIADERRLTADLVVALSPDQLSTPSLCGAWTVRDVSAHLLMPLVTSTPKFVFAMARSGMNFDKANKVLTAGVAGRSTAEIAAGLRANADSRFTPPGLGPEAPLTDALVHGQDMRRPLGLHRDIPEQRQRVVLDFLVGGSAKAFVPASRIAGLRLEASDLDWTWGDGESVTGPAEALMMAIAGRSVALADLSGDGVPVMAERLGG